MKRLWKDSMNLQDNLRRRMPKLTAQYFAEGRQATSADTTWEDMHAFRLRTKRFRYTLELFRDVYGPALDRRIDSLKKVQDYLGDMNDAIVSSTMIDGESVQAKLQKQAESKASKLRKFWSETFDAPGEERRWTAYLVVYACRPPTIPRTRRIVGQP
jgi:CHAD domain-containing protein